MVKRAFVILFLISTVACGSSSTPTAPLPATVAGSWAGTFQFTSADGSQRVMPFVMTLTQTGSSVTGMWSASADIVYSGTVTGATTPSTFAGTFTINLNVATICLGIFAVSGGASGNTVTWTSPGVMGNCSVFPSSISIMAQLR
jgi:hypothetical protein